MDVVVQQLELVDGPANKMYRTYLLADDGPGSVGSRAGAALLHWGRRGARGQVHVHQGTSVSSEIGSRRHAKRTKGYFDVTPDIGVTFHIPGQVQDFLVGSREAQDRLELAFLAAWRNTTDIGLPQPGPPAHAVLVSGLAEAARSLPVAQQVREHLMSQAHADTSTSRSQVGLAAGPQRSAGSRLNRDEDVILAAVGDPLLHWLISLLSRCCPTVRLVLARDVASDNLLTSTVAAIALGLLGPVLSTPMLREAIADAKLCV